MKKSYILSLLMTLFSLSLHAQITQGRFTKGDHPQNDILEVLVNKNTRAFDFSPSVGYFLTNNVMLGGQLAVYNVNQNDVIDYSQWSLRPFARYYLPGNFFLTTALGVGNQRREINQQGGYQDRITFYDLSIGAGKDFFLRGDVALEGVVIYQHSNFSGESLSEDVGLNSLLVDFNLQPFVGAGLDLEVNNPLSTGSILLDVQARLLWEGQEDRDGSFTIDLSPRLGYFLTDNIVVGSKVSLTVLGIADETQLGYGLAPFARYYLPPLTERVYVFGGFSVGFDKAPGDDDAIWNGHLGPGMDYFLSPNVALEGLLAYSFQKTNNAPAWERALVRVGVQVFLRR